MRLANAPVLPFQFANLAETAAGYISELGKLPGSKGKVDLAALQGAGQALLKSARAFDGAYDRALAAGSIFDRKPADLQSLNRILFRSERMLLAPEGLPGRTWFKHQLYAPGFYTGYGVKTLPYVREAVEQQKWQEAAKGVDVISRRLAALAAQLDEAVSMLK
jgi:N-acetylated-alpha-linked acidic dipeptidase